MTQTTRVDPALAAAWLAARSLARGLPAPVADRGGLRVDTRAETEVCRWLFPEPTPAIIALARSIGAPGYFIKLCGTREELEPLTPPPWKYLPPLTHMMIARELPRGAALPGYRIESKTARGVTHVRIIAPGGTEAAGGYAAETADVFVYDRIVTAEIHRRRGLGRALMGALGAARKSSAAQQILTATEDGRKLYTSLGWTVYSPYATITVPPA